MKRIIGIILFLILLVLGGLWLAWTFKTQYVAQVISKHLHVPVTIQSVDVTKTQIDMADLWIGTPSKSRTSTSFSAKTIEADMEVAQILKNPLIIDRIDISDIFVGIEYYENGETNWDTMLRGSSSRPKKGRDYLIRTLTFENLTVEVTQANGQKKRYPTISRMEFHNISSETGLPLKEIEKAIFKLMMKDILDQFNLFKQPLDIPGKINNFPNIFN